MAKMILLGSTFVMNIGLVIALAGLSTSHAAETKVSVTCNTPDPGTYWLGWGTSRMRVGANGQISITFRGTVHDVEGIVCKSGDNSGLVHLDRDGVPWAYIPAKD